MGIRNKLLDFKQRLSDRHMYSIVLVVVGIISAVGIYQYKVGMNYRNDVENQYNRAFHELIGDVNNIEVSLAKGMLVNSPEKMADISSEVFRQAAFAQANLGQLPLSNVQLDKTSRFLSQVGDYTYSLSRKTMANKPVTDQEFNQLQKLHGYALELNKSLNDMQNELYAGRIQFGKLQGTTNKLMPNAVKTATAGKVGDIEKQFKEYPSLIYDGPFSEHIEKAEPQFLKGQAEISVDKAKEVAINFIGKERAINVTSRGEGAGAIKTYGFTANIGSGQNNTSNRTVSVDVTKVGGHVVWMLDNRKIEKATIDMKQAEQKAKMFLDTNNLKNMKQSYYLKEDNTALINFAAVQDNVVVYSDLIKVKVALDNGEIVGYESKGYIMSHQTKRKLPLPKLNENEAKAKVNPRLKIDAAALALIPLESTREVLCYEFKGSFNNRSFIVYINAENGSEEKILMLSETPNGILAM